MSPSPYFRCLLLLFAICVPVGGEQHRYDGHRVLRVKVQTDKDADLMTDLYHSGKYDFWDYPHDVMVGPTQFEEIGRLLEDNGIRYDVWITDVQKLIDGQFDQAELKPEHERARRATTTSPVHEFDYSVYHRYAELDQWVLDTAAKYPSLTEVFTIGRSYEKRLMRGIKIGKPADDVKEAMWINSGIHAREWITPATNIWMTNQLLEDYGNVDNVTRILNRYDMYILPTLNPDGYDYTWNVNRMWRKTRSPNLNSTCVGVDPNRNWETGFGGPGSSGDPCSNAYRGEYIHSEDEVRNAVNYVKEKSKRQKFVFFMDIHSYSQLWLNPWGFQYEHPKDVDDHMAIGNAFAAACLAVNGTDYIVGTPPDVLYIASGIALDWGHGAGGIKYSHTLELRDKGYYGFVLPESQILPTARETYAGLIAAYEYIMNNA